MLSDEKRALIILNYIETPHYSLAAAKSGVSAPTVKKVVSETPFISELVKARKKQGAGGFIRERQDEVLEIIGKCLKELNDSERLREATLSQIISAMSTLLDKFVIEKDGSIEYNDDELSRSLEEFAKTLEEYR